MSLTIDELRAKSKAIWNEMVPGWERHSNYLWETGRKLGEWMIEKIKPSPGQTILELAAGPGMTGFVAAKLIGDGGKLISTDFAPHMVELAKKTAAEVGVTNAEFRVMDAEKMDLPDNSVDAVLCRWGYMLMMDPLAALTETRRVLVPGGKVAFSVWGKPEENVWAAGPGMVMVALGKMKPPDPAAPGGIFSMADDSRIEQLLSDAGFNKWEIEPIAVEWKFEDEDELWSFLNDVAGAVSLVLREMDQESLAEVRTALRAQIESFRVDRSYSFPGVALNVVAE